MTLLFEQSKAVSPSVIYQTEFILTSDSIDSMFDFAAVVYSTGKI